VDRRDNEGNGGRRSGGNRQDIAAKRRRQILAAAERCFARRGFHAATMPDICAEAALSPGTVYRYFRSKDDLIEALVEQDRAENLAALAKMATAPDAAAVVRQAVADTADALDEPGAAAFYVEMLAEAARNPRIAAVLRAHGESLDGAVAALLARGQASGELDPALDPAAAAQVLGALFDGLVVRAAVDPDLDLRALAPVLERAVVAFLGRPEPSQA
jgi:AcrR family transcriptional regulator